MEYAIIRYFNSRTGEVFWGASWPGYRHPYTCLWLVLRLPNPPPDDRWAWPKWAAEEIWIPLEEITDIIEEEGPRKGFWEVWAKADYINKILAPEYITHVGKFPTGILYYAKFANHENLYPCYITYTDKPFLPAAKLIKI